MKMFKEGGLTMEAIKYFGLFFLLVFFSCKTQKKSITTSNPMYDHIPRVVEYDTISGIFFYENNINSYAEFDAVVKASGFIKGDAITGEIYKDGYYVDGWNYVEFLKHKGVDVKFDKESVVTFCDSLMQRSVRNGTYMDKTDINPFCGAYYKKFKLKIEVVFIDTISQRTPLFLDCKEFDKYIRENKGRAYQLKPLPTYIITKFFSWEEM